MVIAISMSGLSRIISDEIIIRARPCQLHLTRQTRIPLSPTARRSPSSPLSSSLSSSSSSLSANFQFSWFQRTCYCGTDGYWEYKFHPRWKRRKEPKLTSTKNLYMGGFQVDKKTQVDQVLTRLCRRIYNNFWSGKDFNKITNLSLKLYQ